MSAIARRSSDFGERHLFGSRRVDHRREVRVVDDALEQNVERQVCGVFAEELRRMARHGRQQHIAGFEKCVQGPAALRQLSDRACDPIGRKRRPSLRGPDFVRRNESPDG